MDNSVKRGDIFYADLSPVVGSEQGGVRPVLIVQNDTGNRHSPTVIAAAITSQTGKAKLPTHIELSARSYGLPKDSVVLLEQIRTCLLYTSPFSTEGCMTDRARFLQKSRPARHERCHFRRTCRRK